MYSYLLKDVLELDKIKNSKKPLHLLRLIAFQVGNKPSLSEPGKQLGIDYKTFELYLDILEKAFVAYNLRGLVKTNKKK